MVRQNTSKQSTGYFPVTLMSQSVIIISRKLLLGPCCAALFASGLWEDRRLTHADGVGGVQLTTVCTLAVEGPGHVAAGSVDARAGDAFVNI